MANPYTLILFALSALALTACASTTPAPNPGQVTDSQTTLAYIAAGQNSLSARYAPVIIPKSPHHTYNRIGTAAARYDQQGKEEIFIDTNIPTYYFQQRGFRINHSTYTNLIYRVHFEKVPNLHLTTGKNGGLFIIITLNEVRQPILITTVHTCGCYLAFIPTNFMPESAFPESWNREEQQVFGITLPGVVRYPLPFSDQYRLLITVKNATHRVSGVSVLNMRKLDDNYEVMPGKIEPMAQLKRLPLNDGSTSFYHDTGSSKGYVKNSFKPFEFLLMSWWVFDAHVGVDKEYGPRDDTGTVFYTSLRPWKRSASDMWDFAEFLRFWGWHLE